MQIVEIIPQKGGKSQVCLDNGISFWLYRKEIVHYQLKTGAALSAEIWEELCTEILEKRAKKRAMYLLQKMDRTEQQLIQKLKENGYPENCIEKALAYVKSYHYIDDERYAAAYIRSRQQQKSRIQLKISLQRKGVPAHIIDAALEEEYKQSEDELIVELLKKKCYDGDTMDRKEKYKIYQYLMRRGFSGASVRRCMGI